MDLRQIIWTCVIAVAVYGLWRLIQDKRKHKVEPTDDLHKVVGPLSEADYWGVIEHSKWEAKSLDKFERELRDHLSVRPLDYLIQFQLRTDVLLTSSFSTDLWCAAHIIRGECDEDEFDAFRGWLISRGKKVFENAIAEPDTLAEIDRGVIGRAQFEEMSFFGLNMFELRTGKKLYDFVEMPENYWLMREESQPKFNWEPDDPGSMRAICPMLLAKYRA